MPKQKNAIPSPEVAKEYQPSNKDIDLLNLAGEGADIPKVEFIRDLFFKERGKIPEPIWKEYPERAYRWETHDSIQNNHIRAGGIMEVVTGGNHPRVKDRKLFDVMGLVKYGGEMILCWTSRDLVVEKEKIINRRFTQKVEKHENPNDKVYRHPHDPKLEAGRITATADTGKPGFELDT